MWAVSMAVSVWPMSGRPFSSTNALPRPEPGMSISTDSLRSPRAIRASATPPQWPSLPTVNGTGRPTCPASAAL